MRFTVVLSSIVTAGLLVGAAAAQAQTNQPWCGSTAGAARECVYGTLAQCEQVMRPQGGDCVRNPAMAGPAGPGATSPGTAGAAPGTPATEQPFCGVTAGGAAECLYPTLAACETSMRPQGGNCIPNPRGR